MSAITERLYRTSTLGHVRMMGRVLNGLEMRCGGKIALLCARQSDFAELNATREDAEGIVNLGLEIEGVQAAALLTEPGRAHQVLPARQGAAGRLRGGLAVRRRRAHPRGRVQL